MERRVGQRRGTVLDCAREAVPIRASFERRASVSRSSATSAIDPSGSTTPPCDVPDCTLIFERPSVPGGHRSASVRFNPSMNARSSSTVLLCDPTSPISPPTEITTPFGCSSRMYCVMSDAGLVVEPLLRTEIGLRQIHERRRVDVDVVEPSGDGLERQLLHRGDFPVRVDGELLGVDLEVIALNEDRAAETLA